MAIAAARHAGVTSEIAIEALSEFINTKRRLELKGTINNGSLQNVKVFDDFAHHPTAIAKTLAGVRAHVGEKRIIAILEPRSNTMKSGVHKETLAASLSDADQVFIFQDEAVKWSVDEMIDQCQSPCVVEKNLATLVNKVTAFVASQDTVVIMSNGGFGGIHEKLIKALTHLG